MIVGLGIDIVEVARIRKTYDRFGMRFLDKIFSPAEHAAFPRQMPVYIASRFAAKEAAVKALGTGFAQGITPACIEVYKNRDGQPYLVLTGKAKIRADTLGISNIALSISHERDFALAMVIMEK